MLPTCIAEKQQLSILEFLVLPGQGSNPRSTTLEVKTHKHYTTDADKNNLELHIIQIYFNLHLP